jgi:arginyl-tRNA synthetase
MKPKIKELIQKAAERAYESGNLPSSVLAEVEIDEPKQDAHGDFSTNFAMISASLQKMAPRKIAETINAHLDDTYDLLEKTEIAGPGFINFYIKPSAWHPVLRDIHDTDERYGASDFGRNQKVQVEFVSANPTGPLHVGHGRGAAVGDSVANILSFSGFDVQREYYINDSGRQILTLGRSVYLRYRELSGETVTFPEECYQGGYISDLAALLKQEEGGNLLGRDESDAIMDCARFAAERIMSGIRDDLKNFGVEFDQWFSEQSLYDSGRVESDIEALRTAGKVYQNDGALWFRTSDYGDEKDRVVVRSNGQTTYFASDIAYHREKFERGFDRVIDVWGADHHGYIARMKAAVEASGYDRDRFDVILVKLVNLLRGGEPVAMSTRAGEFVTLKEVVDEVGCDAARFIFLTRHYESPLDFDLELAKQKTNDNPVYYVQYVHARISSIIRKAADIGLGDIRWEKSEIDMLIQPEEIQLIKALARYPEAVQNSAATMAPHRITYYLMNLASAFHTYYNKHRVLNDDPALGGARLYLVEAVRKVIRNGLSLLGVSAPEKM